MIKFDHQDHDLFKAVGATFSNTVDTMRNSLLKGLDEEKRLSEIIEEILRNVENPADRLMAMFTLGGFINNMIDKGMYSAMDANDLIIIVDKKEED